MPRSSPSLTCAMLTTLYVSSQGMRGQLPLTPPQGIMNTLLCPLASLTPLLFSKPLLMTCSGTCSTSLFLSTLMTFRFFSRSLQEHVSHVRKVLGRLLENHLYVKPEKCEFHTTNTQFLGFIIRPGQVRMDPKKVQAVLDWPVPTSVKEVQRFIGFAIFYRKFCAEL